MTHFPNIHQRAETLVRESRGRLNLREAYAELSRRSQLARLLIPTDAKRSHAFGRKCRAEFARVPEIFRDGKPSTYAATSHYNLAVKYEIGKIVTCDKWCDDFTQECAGGIHFFVTRLEAEACNL